MSQERTGAGLQDIHAITESVLGQMPPRDTTALVRGVRDRLRLAITLGEIHPGSRLNQVALAKQLGVSRMPVRTAVSELVAEGLLELVPGGGVTVRTLTAQDLRDVYEVRVALESSAVRHVAARQPPWGLAQIEQVVATHQPLVPSYGAQQMLEADRNFHMAILEATENSFFKQAIVPVWATVERAMVQMLHMEGVFTRAWEEHALIAEALRLGDPDLAEQRLRLHLDNAADELANALQDHAAPLPSAGGQD
jgi:DNA-binding GntR family transcriptional regulator